MFHPVFQKTAEDRYSFSELVLSVFYLMKYKYSAIQMQEMMKINILTFRVNESFSAEGLLAMN